MTVMRVIAGSARGHLLAAPAGLVTRPTTDRMKENLFNILAPLLSGASFLDLFSGSGAIGIEALSRGAISAVFVDKCHAAQAAIYANLQKTRLAPLGEVLPFSYEKALRHLAARGRTFDIIFMDPPYGTALISEALARLCADSVLANDGVIVAEMDARETPPEDATFMIDKRKIYSGTQFVFYKHRDRMLTE